MAGKARINVVFNANLKEFSDKMQNATRSIKKMGRQMQNVGKTLSVGVTAPFAAFAAVSLKSWDEQEKAIAQVETGLRSTGNAVGYTSEQLQKMASSLQNNTLFGDEEILKDVTSQLLTFTNIAGTQFERTQQAALDLATRLDGDLKSASIQLGKALNDPVANLSALSRSGIQFSEEQKAVINSLVETNRLADAQTIILDELEKQYGGSAEAAARAGLGGLKQLQNSIGDLGEEFGKIIGQALLPFVDRIRGIVQSFQALSPETKKTITIIGALGASIGPVLVAMGYLLTNVVPGLVKSFVLLRAEVLKLNTAMLLNPWVLLGTAVAGVITYFAFFNDTAEETIQKQNILAAVNEKAAKSVASEKAKLQELLFIAKNENIAKSARIKAVKELNQLSPKYLGDLTLEKINTDEARKAVELYNNELIRTAKVKAAQAKLEELQSKIIDAELAAENASVANAKEQLNIQNNQNLSVAQKNKLLSAVNSAKELGNILGEKNLETLKAEEQQLLKIISANQTLNVVKSNGSPTNSFRPRAKSTGLTSESMVGVQGTGLATGIEAETPKIESGLNNIQSAVSDFSVNIGGLMENAATNFLTGFGQILGGLMSGTASFSDMGNLFLGSLANLLTQLGQIAIKVGLGIKGIKKALLSLNPIVAIAAGAALVAFGSMIRGRLSDMGGSRRGGFAGSFANGGIVGGSSFTGDRLFARVNSGEMILNKRQQGNLMGMLSPAGGNLNIRLTGEFRQSGKDLKLVIDEYIKTNSRLR